MVFFHAKVVKIKHYLEKNSYPLSFIDKQVSSSLRIKKNKKNVTANATNSGVKYYKLPYIGHISTDVKRKINRCCKFYCKKLNIKVALTPFKVPDIFSEYKFVCPHCNACYIGETFVNKD